MTPAPGWPGIPPRWTSSAKSGVGTALSLQSRVWFTLSHGIVNEVYFPRMDQANTRDLGLIVTDRKEFFSEEKRFTRSRISPIVRGVPGYRMVNECMQGRYRITKTIVTDTQRDVLLQEIRFEALVGDVGDYAVFALLAPHVENGGMGNDAWAGAWKGVPMLFARRGGTALALACSVPFRTMSCGYVGISDGWQELRARRTLVDVYSEARNGNVALTGELDFATAGGTVVLALGFGRDSGEAGHNARAALLSDFSRHASDYIGSWQAFQRRCLDLGDADESGFDAYRVSTAVLKTHQGKRFDGAFIASLSIPWGTSKGDDDLGGYHLTWPRDLVESAGALLAAGDADGARRALVYLMATQEPDGHWPQNMWADGAPYWNGIQLDEAAFPILLADALRRTNALDGLDAWAMAKRAAGYIVRYGPATQQDRWEERAGYSPFTLAVEIAALLAAADMAAAAGERSIEAYLRETADAWNDAIERWTYVSGTVLARACGVTGYYVRIAPPGAVDAPGIPLPRDNADDAAARIVSVDALALVRFGLRAADDSRIRDTVVVIDRVLRTETRTGPAWHRYNGDRYGEHANGSPYDGDGIGRVWPLLAGERAHYELASGRSEVAAALGRTMLAQSSPGRLIPEQVWDGDDLPALGLFNGRPAGSAMPLVWAHAEYVKLRRSLRDGKVFDLPPQPVRRYQVDRVASRFATWRQNLRCAEIAAGMTLRIELTGAAVVHWSADGWNTVTDTPTVDTSLGVHVADLPTAALPAGATLRFTFRWCDESRWQGENYACAIVTAGVERTSANEAR
ncbi:MAG TPA: glucan 1,4-alpha-glucosidase [Casimicrobiaceae bacterium]|nr:glucan 1,4-alpha-glucosidase [Casimicrobiaceae bacterium]